jgi:hypothetical protein
MVCAEEDGNVGRHQKTLLFAVVLALAAGAGASARRSRRWVTLFNGKDLSGWHARHADAHNGWTVENGLLMNTPSSTDLISDQKFQDFDLHYEYMIPPRSNSGVYLRGRYEIQIQDDYGKPPESHINGAIYGIVTPTSNPSRHAGEWQTVDARIVADRATVILNGTKIIDNAAVRVTGSALDGQETDPGPIMLQGDHGKITFRNLRLRPIEPGTAAGGK